MELYKAIENLKFDTRLVEKNINLGTLPQEEWNKHLSNLKDLKEQVLQVSLESEDNLNGEYPNN